MGVYVCCVGRCAFVPVHGVCLGTCGGMPAWALLTLALAGWCGFPALAWWGAGQHVELAGQASAPGPFFLCS